MDEIVDIKIIGNAGVGKGSIAKIIYDALTREGITCCGETMEDCKKLTRPLCSSNIAKDRTVCIIEIKQKDVS